MVKGRTVKECLVRGGVEGKKFVGSPEGGSCVYEIKRIEQTPDLYTRAYVRWDIRSGRAGQLSPQNLAWLLNDTEFISVGETQ